ncbi:MAG TPA: TIGR01777 family oxidoreductase [Bacteroidales bacterium]|nr:TIGR01777 family oxidoreductase [Bacteroidales bacterium]
MHFSISGSTGFIGQALLKMIVARGWTATVIDRMSFEMPEEEFARKKIAGSEVIINLAGSPISGRWTPENKKEMLDSRILTTRKIARAIRLAPDKPRLLISASGTGIYDSSHSHTEESLDFDSGFLADLCRQWEEEAFSVAELTRVVVCRTGLVLGKEGGILERLQPLFGMGLGAVVGSGDQKMPWIHLDDLLAAYQFVIGHEEIRGIVNLTAPYSTTNYEFTHTFGKVLTQPIFLKVPGFALRMIYGEGASTLITGQKVIPEKLLKSGFEFKFPTVVKALMNLYPPSIP